MTKPAILYSFVLFTACNSSDPDTSKRAHDAEVWSPPAAGTVVASDSTRVISDPLNNFYFGVSLRVSEGNTDVLRQGFRYDVRAFYGHAVADGMIVMPVGGEHLRPLLRRATDSSFIIGFIPGAAYGGDTDFREYYRINGGRHGIGIKALKGFMLK